MFLPCYHTEWFIGPELTQVSLFGQVCLCIASQDQVFVTFVKMRSVPSCLLQSLRNCDCKKPSWQTGINLLGVTSVLCPTSGK